MSYLYRCTKIYKTGMNKGQRCFQRHSFKRKVEDYIVKKVCPSCKNEVTYMDKHQMKKNKDNTCKCDGVSYPHRKGCEVWCEQHPTGPTEQDYKDRYGY